MFIKDEAKSAARSMIAMLIIWAISLSAMLVA